MVRQRAVLRIGDPTLEVLPAVRVTDKLDLSSCTSLRELPPGLKCGSIDLHNCSSLERLPEGIDCHYLNISDCINLKQWPKVGSIKFGHLVARGCLELTYLPEWLGPLAQLDLRNCSALNALPEGLEVRSWLDIANTGITSLPQSMSNVLLRWQGVLVNQRIVLHPESITVNEIITEQNVEVRRVMIQRMGYQRFIDEAGGQTLDVDTDAGGERRLLRVPILNDEDLVCVSVFCPSTGHQYMLRVPPTMTTCRQAVAWIAGFDNPEQYQLLAET